MSRLIKVMIVLSNCEMNNLDGFLRILIQFYTCLTNAAKHFTIHHHVQQLDYGILGLEDLIRYSKSLAKSIYELLIPYVEKRSKESKETTKKRKLDLQAQKQKLDKGTKLIPKLVFSIENFSKWVGIVDQKAKKNFSKYLFVGVLRDFSLKNKKLMDAINKEKNAASQQSIDDPEVFDLDDEENFNVSDCENSDVDENRSDEETVATHQSEQIVEENDGEESAQRLMLNMQTINKKTSKRNRIEPVKLPSKRTARGVLKSKENKRK